jgi:hypothetical protein
VHHGQQLLDLADAFGEPIAFHRQLHGHGHSHRLSQRLVLRILIHGVVAGVVVVAPPTQLIDTLDDGGVFTFTVVGAVNGVPVVVVVVVVVGVVVPPFLGAPVSDVRSLEQALVTEGAELHVGQDDPPVMLASPPQPMLARAPTNAMNTKPPCVIWPPPTPVSSSLSRALHHRSASAAT